MIRFTAALVAAGMLLCACQTLPTTATVAADDHALAPPTDAQPVDFDALLVRRDHQQRLADGMPIQIDNPYGDVRLRFGGYEHVVELHVTEQRPDPEQPTFDYVHQVEDGRYRIAPQLAAGTALQPAQRTDLVVFVPTGHAVVVTTARGLVEGRGLKSDLNIRSEAGNIMLRGTSGLLDVQTGEGSIEVALEDAAAGSSQRLVTTTGSITAALADSANLEVELASSAPLTTDFSLDIQQQPGQEPNKRAHAVIGKPQAHLQIESKRGDIRLLRRAAFTPVASS